MMISKEDMSEESTEEKDLVTWLPSIFCGVICNGTVHDNCLSCQHVFGYIEDNFNKSCSNRDIARAIRNVFPNSKRIQIGDEEKTRIFCGLGFHSDKHSVNRAVADKVFGCFDQWKKASDGDAKEKLKREMQQLVFYNPGPSTKDLLGFKPEFSNREKRKLNRLLEDKHASEEKRERKPKRAALHDSIGCLKETDQDLCDCMIEDCPGCHYPCPQCQSEKCGSTCRCDRKWTYDVCVL